MSIVGGYPLRTGSFASDVKMEPTETVLNLDLLITVYAISVNALCELMLILSGRRNQQIPTSQGLLFLDSGYFVCLLVCSNIISE